MRQLCGALSLVFCTFNADAASTQFYPNKPIRVIVPVLPGGGTDFIARPVGLRLGATLGQSVIIDNRGGANGNLGTELSAKALPDGYTLLIVSATLVVNPSLYRNLSYDPVKDFAPITQLMARAYILLLHPAVPAKSVKEFIALAMSKKGGITYSSGGIGGGGHLGMELLRALAGFDATHVPYKGAGPALIDLIGGQVEATIVAVPAGLPHVRNGRVKAIAVTSLKRSPLLPDLPTVAESGVPGYDLVSWDGMLAPAGTPRAIVTRLHEEVSKILKLPDVVERIVADGGDPIGSTPQEYSTFIKAEIVKWEKVIKQSGAKVE